MASFEHPTQASVPAIQVMTPTVPATAPITPVKGAPAPPHATSPVDYENISMAPSTPPVRGKYPSAFGLDKMNFDLWDAELAFTPDSSPVRPARTHRRSLSPVPSPVSSPVQAPASSRASVIEFPHGRQLAWNSEQARVFYPPVAKLPPGPKIPKRSVAHEPLRTQVDVDMRAQMRVREWLREVAEGMAPLGGVLYGDKASDAGTDAVSDVDVLLEAARQRFESVHIQSENGHDFVADPYDFPVAVTENAGVPFVQVVLPTIPEKHLYHSYPGVPKASGYV
ncbi:hypothetical protein BD626DRAFT_27510 [Schizophyllum amplum]|uniref:Uncharacterized protein n=1 Tax=Schizophyllum amplum TaxID=97359 RepID=A0A550CZY0_9AGAR|nr:hypothetical protein BD626DRAFT_27510 [Auriculariopsis ampla]